MAGPPGVTENQVCPPSPQPSAPTWASLLFGPLFVRPFLFLSAVTTIITTVLSLPQMLLHLLQRVQAVLDLYIWSWARREGPSPWGELVPRGLGLGFRCTLAQVCQDAQSFLLPFLRGTGHTKENIKHVSPWGALDGQRGHPRLTRQNQ